MKYNVGDLVDYKDSSYTFKSCTVLGYSNHLKFYVVQIPEKYKIGWTSGASFETYFDIKVGTENCWYAEESELSPSKSNKGWNNPRGKNGRFTTTKKSSLEQRIAALEKKFEALQKAI